MQSLIRLFRAVLVTDKNLRANRDDGFLAKTIQEGFIFSDEVLGEYASRLPQLFETTKQAIGFNAKQANSSFHKSWKKVRDADMEQLVTEQIIHYFTTYGFQGLGIFNHESVYIPNEVLEIPDKKTEGILLIVIRGFTQEEIKEKLLALLATGMALSEETITDVLGVSAMLGLSADEVENIKNKEVKAALYSYLGIIPQNPVEFLRYAVYKSTETTLLIKNDELISKIKEKKNLDILALFEAYEKKYDLANLSEIFYRFKPLFLAFKTNDGLKKKINKIRKLAIKNHKPMPEDYLNTVTARIANGSLNEHSFKKALADVNIFRKIRLAYALNFRAIDATSILYKIRNGKGYAAEFNVADKWPYETILGMVMESIIEDISQNVKGKKIYIPQNIVYALPATEKQFTGMFPSGTYIKIPKDMVFGVHWNNVKNHSIDLDLSLLSVNEKYGWDSSYRNGDRSILFSGDMTDASGPSGASELFYVQKQQKSDLLMMLNYYNFSEDTDVPFTIFVGQQEVAQLERNHVIDPNNIVAIAGSAINKKQLILGLIKTTPQESRFYFSETNMGRSISSSNSDFATHARQYLSQFYENSLSLNNILDEAGAEIVDDLSLADINLSSGALAKNTIIDLLVK